MLEMKRRIILLYIPIDLFTCHPLRGPGLGRGDETQAQASPPGAGAGAAVESPGRKLCRGRGAGTPLV